MNYSAFEPLAEALGWDIDSDSTLVTFATAEHAGPPRLSESWPLMDDAVRGAEAEIARRGLSDNYVWAILDVMGVETNIARDELSSTPMLFALITAPPETRVRAMLAVLEAHSPILRSSEAA